MRYAEEHTIDHIFTGHFGHLSFERWLLGPTARQEIDHAACAVTVISGLRGGGKPCCKSIFPGWDRCSSST
ncbi:universal stress protein [Pseudomonas sp. AO-1]|uniref:universal stress protein n=1 Tax=Pseudomonas sp. AO-1 TaxID=2855434 RepID=UPI0021B0EB2B|nr:universal stress protein [Pseudomonas sp. AO-1]